MYMHIKNGEGLLKRKLSVFKRCVTKQVTTKVRKYCSELELVEMITGQYLLNLSSAASK